MHTESFTDTEVWRVLTTSDVGYVTQGQGVTGGTHQWCAACPGILPFAFFFVCAVPTATKCRGHSPVCSAKDLLKQANGVIAPFHGGGGGVAGIALCAGGGGGCTDRAFVFEGFPPIIKHARAGKGGQGAEEAPVSIGTNVSLSPSISSWASLKQAM